MYKNFLKRTLLFFIVFAIVNCKNPFAPESSNNPQKTDGKKLFIVESDFQSGLVEWMNAEEKTISSISLSIYSDAKIFSYGSYLYILERYGADNILKIDPSGGELKIVYQKHLGNLWNPYDIEFVNANKAYIANQNEPVITIFNPEDGNILGGINISQYTYMPDSNKSPYACAMTIADDYLYVLLQRRNSWLPGAPSLILKVSAIEDKIVDTIGLRFTNGYDIVHHNGMLYITNPGDIMSIGDGGIEAVKISTKEITTIIEEKDFGGNPNKIIHKKDDLFYVISYVGWGDVRVVELNVNNSTVKEIEGIKNVYEGICYDKEEDILYVGERDSLDAGIKILKDNKIIDSKIKSNKSLPPVDILLF